ncbi:hypothetical protein [Nonomuraea sp. LPB2021202275-12-8]|uniref:hypothetical protein n=1 Tax=Nonomuraea sp. LPB2021202275-12-8 TaxID=3120159 RepID=UPI00300D3C62
MADESFPQARPGMPACARGASRPRPRLSARCGYAHAGGHEGPCGWARRHARRLPVTARPVLPEAPAVPDRQPAPAHVPARVLTPVTTPRGRHDEPRQGWQHLGGVRLPRDRL